MFCWLWWEASLGRKFWDENGKYFELLQNNAAEEVSREAMEYNQKRKDENYGDDTITPVFGIETVMVSLLLFFVKKTKPTSNIHDE